ncbi:MAG: NAD(P)/FAD-dependent oxidoreductase [Verrucomicrobia bacterium]|nr:NAD(P)/FAD-dependent oxidoreductase [Verrucomicrobiota bacterium]
MKTLLILGAGTGGTLAANKLARRLDPREWEVVVVDRDERHLYQPGFLFIPFGQLAPADAVKPKRNFLPRGTKVIFSDIVAIEAQANRVKLTNEPRVISYDQLIIATGCEIAPEEVPGLKDGGWRKNIFDFYTLGGATALGECLRTWPGGRLVLNVAEMPIKCPIAPLEFLFLADWFFRQRGIRSKVELTLATPLAHAFTKPKAAAVLGGLLKQKGIQVVPDFALCEVDNARTTLVSYDNREVGYDLLVTIPVCKGAEVIARSGMGDELNYVETNKHTLQSRKWPNVWVIGDAGDAPTAKAGSVAHFMADVLVENFLHHVRGEPLADQFDGHANCFIESGFGKSFLIDYNYTTEPLPGLFPLPVVGPFPLLKESRLNHWGKLLFRWVYWHMLLPGRLPLPSRMSLAGKRA